MEIKIEINDEDFSQFAQKTAELGLDPLDTIELIITKSLNERNLKSSIIKQEKLVDDAFRLFIDFENKMKKYNIHQSSIAHYLQTTQASISRALKSKKNNTLLFEQISILQDKLLVYAYIYQNGHSIDFDNIECKKPLPKQSILFINALAGKVELNLNYKFSEGTFLNILCNFVKTELFKKLDFETIYSDIDEFIDTINEIADNYFYERYGPNKFIF